MELLESDSARPRQARYQAALRPDMTVALILTYFGNLCEPPHHRDAGPALGRDARQHGLCGACVRTEVRGIISFSSAALAITSDPVDNVAQA